MRPYRAPTPTTAPDPIDAPYFVASIRSHWPDYSGRHTSHSDGPCRSYSASLGRVSVVLTVTAGASWRIDDAVTKLYAVSCADELTVGQCNEALAKCVATLRRKAAKWEKEAGQLKRLLPG